MLCVGATLNFTSTSFKMLLKTNINKHIFSLVASNLEWICVWERAV
jgi:hypothetical protein